jgi:hypothetical protein
MATRSNVNIVTQLGVESTPGTSVPANRLVNDIAIRFSPMQESKLFRSSGAKIPTAMLKTKEWSEGEWDGVLNFGSLIYPLAGAVAYAAPVETSGGSAAYKWTFNPATHGSVTRKNYTLQRGDATAAIQVAYGQFDGFKLSVTREDVQVSGALFAKNINNGVTLTASPTEIAQRPASPANLDVYIDSTFAGIGTTRWTCVSKVDVDIPPELGQKWCVNSSQASWDEPFEKAHEPKVVITAEYNAQGRALYDALSVAGLPTRFVRVQATGNPVGTAADVERFRADFALKFEKATEVADQDGPYEYQFEFAVIHDPTMGRGYSFEIINDLSAL